MGVKRDWICAAHGVFESDDEAPLCPSGCDVVDKIFIQPPGLSSARTANIDRTLESLARSHGMTDISNRGGRAAKGPSAAHERRQADLTAAIRERYGGTGWGSVPAGGTLNVGTGKVEGEGPGVAAAISQYGGHADNALGEVKAAGALIKKPVMVRHDHENLKVDVSKAA